MKKSIGFRLGLTAVIMLLVFSSCKTTKVYDPIYDVEKVEIKKDTDNDETKEDYEKGELKELSQKLGIEINSEDNLRLYKEVEKWIGVPYRYGGETKRGVDCSGLVSQLYLEVFDKKLYRSSASIHDKNCRRIKKGDLETGDLVFFATGKSRKRINHVGLYLKDGKFIHASSSRGVVISSLDDKYFQRTYISSGRVIE